MKLKFFLTIIIFFISCLESSTNKTYLMQRSLGVNLALEKTTFYELLQIKNDYKKYEPIKKKFANLFLVSFQIIPFYSESTNKDNLGRYFGIKNDKIIRFKERNYDADQLNISYIIHASTAGSDDYSVAVELKPEQNVIGLVLNSYHDLDCILNGLFFKASVPIVHLKNNLNINTIQETLDIDSYYYSGILLDYFSGKYEIKPGKEESQMALREAKIYGSQSNTKIADIDLIFGFYLLDDINKYLTVNIDFILPTGNKPNGEFLFEPICGNGRHWSFGLGLDFSFILFDDKDQSFRVNMLANYRYLFSGTEKRTLGIKNFDYGQYYCIGKNGDYFATPAANVLTQDVYVDPKNQIDATCMLTYNSGNLTGNLGYNFFAKSAESVSAKNWQDNKYGIINNLKDFSGGLLDVNSEDDWFNSDGFDNAKINKSNLDVNVASTPSYLTHKIYAGIGYIFRDSNDVPVLLGFGASYEFAQKNNELEYWSIWGKFGFSF